MRKKTILVLAMGFILCSALAASANPRVLMIVKDGSDAMDLMLKEEVGVMISLLSQAGYEPLVATKTGKLLKGRSTSLQPELRLSDVCLGDYVGVMVPCMAYGIGNGIAAEGVSLIKEAFDQGMPIAAQQGGVAFLAQAGILKGKRFAITQGYEAIAPDGIYQGSGVTTDGMIVTAGVCPYQAAGGAHGTTEDLTREFIKLIDMAQP